ncbi:MFS transporter [Methylobacterium variabile]|jgi:MFS family permease|uniref:MFS transporter n=1 Tax=Methylobacterium variabile TaxID=298794 RepID=UPI001FD823A3|nr:MFS transporter [Methylobacterium variabile]
MACGSLGGFLLTWPLGGLSDRLDRRLVIVAVALAASASLLAMLRFVPDDARHWVFFACVTLFGGTVIPTYSIVIAHVNDTVDKGEFVAASGGLLILQGAGAAAGPVVAGLAMSNFRYGLSGTILTAQLLMAAWGLYRILARPMPADADRGEFVVEPPVPVGTELLAEGGTR